MASRRCTGSTRHTGSCGTGMATGWCANECGADTGEEEHNR